MEDQEILHGITEPDAFLHIDRTLEHMGWKDAGNAEVATKPTRDRPMLRVTVLRSPSEAGCYYCPLTIVEGHPHIKWVGFQTHLECYPVRKDAWIALIPMLEDARDGSSRFSLC